MIGEKSFVENEDGYIAVLALLDKFAYEAHILVGFNGIYSMEQLWLAFVMKTCHNKVWTGDKWNDD